MLFLLSPAKTFSENLKSPVEDITASQFLDKSAELVDILKPQSATDIAKLMHVSENISHLNYQRFQVWENNSRLGEPAMFRFYGDVYKGLEAETFSKQDTLYAQDHLGILSGLYGFLRPLDRMQDYRLEMGTKLQNGKGKDLYTFWSETITDYLNHHSADVLVNLASKEYSSVINSKKLKKPMIEIVFKEHKGDSYKIVAIYAKKARGVFARWAIQNRIEKPEDLIKFSEEGYGFEASLSTGDSLVFIR